MAGRASQLAAGVCLAAGAVAVALLLGEGLARVAYVEPQVPAPPEPPAELADLPVIESLLDLAKPNVRAVNAGVLHRTNSAGMRGGEVSRRPAPGTYRVALAGDSYTMGHRILAEAPVAGIRGLPARCGFDRVRGRSRSRSGHD